MTTRSQRLFCFLVALVATGGQNGLSAQVPASDLRGMSSLSFRQSAGTPDSENSGVSVQSLPPLRFAGVTDQLQSGEMGQKAGKITFKPFDFENFSANTADFAPIALTANIPSMPLSVVSVRQFIPSDNYYNQSGFFCKREWELERNTHIPLRFRLGSLAQCNALEGKP